MSRSRQAPAQSSAPRPPKRPAERRPERGPGARGWPGAGGGKTSLLEAPPEFRATTVQVCGLWPWIVGSGVPLVGVPLGRHLFSRATVCSDPINWFSRGGLIANPSVLVLGRPGLGKSTLVCRMCLGLDYYGYRSVVLGDLKPDYAELIAALGGNVVTLGRGHGTLNVLDPGAAVTAAEVTLWSVMQTTSRCSCATRSASSSRLVTASPETAVWRWQSTRTSPFPVMRGLERRRHTPRGSLSSR